MIGLFAVVIAPLGAEGIPTLVSTTTILCLVIVVLNAYRYYFIRQQWNNRHGICEYCERFISPQGMQSRTSNTTTFFRWDACSQFKLSSNILTIYRDPPTMFYILPRRLFATEADWQECLQIMSQNLTQR